MSASTATDPAALSEETRLPWGVLLSPPPSDLPYDDGERMESPWHAQSAMILKAAYVAAHGGVMTDYYIGVNMFVYYSWKQIRNDEYRGPDMYFVKGVDGTKPRLYWAIWDEDGKYPDVIIELLSPSTERVDLEMKKDLYEQRFRTPEYFCIAPEVERLLGWRLGPDMRYHSLTPNEHGRLWSEQLGFWIGPWRGVYMGEERTWPRLFHPDGTLVLLPEEAERQRAEAERQRAEELAARAEAERQRAEELAARAETERQRAEELAARIAALEAELARLRERSDR